MKFNNESNEDKCLDYEETDFRLTDTDARKIIQRVSKCENATEFQLLDNNQRDRYIRVEKRWIIHKAN